MACGFDLSWKRESFWIALCRSVYKCTTAWFVPALHECLFLMFCDISAYDVAAIVKCLTGVCPRYIIDNDFQ
jgi:hypothetical protein